MNNELLYNPMEFGSGHVSELGNVWFYQGRKQMRQDSRDFCRGPERRPVRAFQ